MNRYLHDRDTKCILLEQPDDKSGDLLIDFQKKKEQSRKRKKAQWFLHLAKQDLYWLHY